MRRVITPATDLWDWHHYSHLAPRLRIVPSEAVARLRAMAGSYDVLYSVFGAVCFTDPRRLLPAAAQALRPGSRTSTHTFSAAARATPRPAHCW